MQFVYELRSELDRQIQDHRLVELHTHLMGMGDADFWVHLIIETYIPRSTEFAKAHLEENFDVFYSVDHILEASGYHYDKGDQYAKELARAKLESKMFDGFRHTGEDLPAFFTVGKQLGPNVGSKRKRSPTDDGDVHGVYNSTLAKYLAISGVSSPFHAVVRNWFQFLDPAGNPVSHADILETCESVSDPLSSDRCAQTEEISLLSSIQEDFVCEMSSSNKDLRSTVSS
jgi:hypothetical protein